MKISWGSSLIKPFALLALVPSEFGRWMLVAPRVFPRFIGKLHGIYCPFLTKKVSFWRKLFAAIFCVLLCYYRCRFHLQPSTSTFLQLHIAVESIRRNHELSLALTYFVLFRRTWNVVFLYSTEFPLASEPFSLLSVVDFIWCPSNIQTAKPLLVVLLWFLGRSNSFDIEVVSWRHNHDVTKSK